MLVASDVVCEFGQLSGRKYGEKMGWKTRGRNRTSGTFRKAESTNFRISVVLSQLCNSSRVRHSVGAPVCGFAGVEPRVSRLVKNGRLA